MVDILELMVKQNPWWNSSAPIPKLKRRFLFNDLIKYLHTKQILSITGIRRAGKTTIMKQVIRHLIENTHNAKSILYFSFDELLAEKPSIIEEVLEIYEKNILKADLQNVFIFLDEIQHIERWEVILKRYYDLDQQIKFIVSGSSSIHIKKAKESLAGREYEFHLQCLDFSEFVYFRTGKIFPKISCKNMYAQGEKLYNDFVLEKDQLEKLFYEFIEKGGFPEIVEEEIWQNRKQYVKTVLEKIIYRDMAQYFSIQEPAKMMEILHMLKARPGMCINYSSFASDLGVTRQTIMKYFLSLESAFVIRMLNNYRKNSASQIKKLKKAYFYDHSFILTFMDGEEAAFEPQLASFLIENIVINKVGAGYFWEKNYEVDIVYKDKERIIPIEIKWKEKTVREMKGIEIFLQKYTTEKGIVITKKTFQKEETKIHLPAWFFLLVVEQ